MSEPSSESPADDEQDKPGLLDRILGRTGGDHRGPADEEVAEQEERAEVLEEQGSEDQPAQDTGGASRSDDDDADSDSGSDSGNDADRDSGHESDSDADSGEDSEEHDDLETDSEGEPSVGAMPAADDVDQEEIEKDRSERLDPENRPDNVEIDNTDRDFDSEKGMFTDAEGYDDAEKKYDDDAF